MKVLPEICLFIFLLNAKVFAWQKYVLPCNAHLLEVSRKVLIGEIGTKEISNKNDGSEIEKYLKPLNLPKGSPYCLAGQYFCFYSAAKILNLPFNNIPLPKTGHSIFAFRFAKRFGVKVEFKAYLDDLVVWQKGKSIFGHTERIIAVFRKGWVKTVGFNTKTFDTREKRWVEGVFIWHRNLLHPIGNLHLLGLVGFQKVKNVH